MSDAQCRAVELARFYFRRLAQEAGATWDGDNDVEIELMVSNAVDAAAERLRPQLDDAVKRIRRLEDDLARQMAVVLGELRMLDGLRPACVFCADAAADRQTSRGPACTDCAGGPPGSGPGPDPDRPETWALAEVGHGGEPRPEPSGPGPETDDEGRAGEYRYPWPEDYQRGM
jgi:hypothetical protein